MYRNKNLKRITGSYYTPIWVVDLILDQLGYKYNIINKRIIDPACGDGAFLAEIVQRYIKDSINMHKPIEDIKALLSTNIYGFDISKQAVEKCKINLDEVASRYHIESVNWQIFRMNSLNKNKVSKYFSTFDYVVGNPPYVRCHNIEPKARDQIKKDWSFCNQSQIDLYICFFELGLSLLNDNGKLGYITPNSYFVIESATKLREYFIKHSILKKIINYRHSKIFKNALTYTAITIIDMNWGKNYFFYFDLRNNKLKKVKYVGKVNLSMLDTHRWILGSPYELQRIKNILSRGIPLGILTKIKTDIRINPYHVYVLKKPIIDGNYACVKIKGKKYKVEKELLKPVVKVNRLKSTNDEQNSYVIFPYKKVNNEYTIIPEDELKRLYPNAYDYLLKHKAQIKKRKQGNNKIVWYAFPTKPKDEHFTTNNCILAPRLSSKPRFIVWKRECYIFALGVCIRYNGDIDKLAKQLNSEDMEIFINCYTRDYSGFRKSYDKKFIFDFGINIEGLQNNLCNIT